MDNKRSNKPVFAIYGAIFMLIVLSVLVGKCRKGNSEAEPTAKVHFPGIGETMHSNYFDITVNRVISSSYFDTGNPYTSLEADANSYYLILSVTYKNTDTESRNILGGDLLFNYNDRILTYDKREWISNGWEQINPVETFTGTMIYKIPKEVHGLAYFKPARASENAAIYLGIIDERKN